MRVEGAFPAPPIRTIHVTLIWRAVQTSHHYLQAGGKKRVLVLPENPYLNDKI
jgi:hypothetical protein